MKVKEILKTNFIQNYNNIVIIYNNYNRSQTKVYKEKKKFINNYSLMNKKFYIKIIYLIKIKSNYIKNKLNKIMIII